MKHDHVLHNIKLRVVELLPSGLAIAQDMDGDYKLHDFDVYYGYTSSWPSPQHEHRWRAHIFAPPKPRNKYADTQEGICAVFRKMAAKIECYPNPQVDRGLKLVRPSVALQTHVMKLILERGR